VRVCRGGLVVPVSGLAFTMLFTLVGGLSVPSATQAIIISEAKFVELGGNLGAVDQSFHGVAAKLRARSLAPQFLVSGWLDRCTATWLGEEAFHTYLLTAAHCVNSGSGLAKASHHTFLDWYGHVIASGRGWAFKPPTPAGASSHWDYAEDIAVLRLPRISTPADADGRRLERPTIAEEAIKVRDVVHFAGYGLTGVGMRRLELPRKDRRMAGEATVSHALSEGRGVVYTSYDPVNASPSWAFPFKGDSGSAWWRHQGGYWLVSGVTAGGTDKPLQGMSPQVSRHAAWINGIFPGAVLHSERMSVTADVPFESRNHGLDPSGDTVHFVVPPQAGVTGPTFGQWSGAMGDTLITVEVTETRTGAADTVRLRAHRDAGCRRAPIEDATPCAGSRTNQLKIEFRAQDNPHLKPGAYIGRFEVDAVAGGDRSRHERLGLHLDIRHLLRGQVSTTTAYVSPNLAERARYSAVYFTVPAQQRAWGPAAGVWNGSDVPSQIFVMVRDAVTQQEHEVVLRARRDLLCGDPRRTRMEDAVTCQRRSAGPVTVRFHREDNPHLPAGLHRGRVTLQAHDWMDRGFHRLIELDVDLDTLETAATAAPAQAMVRVSPSPYRLLSHRPQIVGCAGLTPTSAR